MKISIFPNFCSLAAKEPLLKFIESLFNDNINVVENDMNADIAIIQSVLWAGRMRPNKTIWDHYQAQNKPIIVLEVGGLIRNKTWKIGINGINADADFCNDNCDDERVQKLGLKLKPWKKIGDNIIICGQHGDSEQWRYMPPMTEWILSIIDELKKYTDRKIIIRPHPRYKVTPKYKYKNVLIANPRQINGSYDNFNFEETLERSWAVVSYSSNPANCAVMEGTPVFVGSSSLAYPVGHDINDLSKIEEPIYPDRTQWLNNLSYTEWSVEELASGLPWKRLKPKISMLLN